MGEDSNDSCVGNFVWNGNSCCTRGGAWRQLIIRRKYETMLLASGGGGVGKLGICYV